jgi:hypothetical protein
MTRPGVLAVAEHDSLSQPEDFGRWIARQRHCSFMKPQVHIRQPLAALSIVAIVTTMLAWTRSHGQNAGTGIQAQGQPSPNTVGIYDQSGSTQVNAPITIPRFFRKGEITRYAQPTIAGTPAAVWQCDVKNRWDDGSLKFGIVSLVIPQLPAKRGVTIGFANNPNRDSGSQGDVATGFLVKAAMLAPVYDFEAAMHLTGSAMHDLSARAILNAAKFRYWLQGPVVTAVVLEDREGRTFDVNTDGAEGKPLHPIFEAWFYPANAKVQVGFTLENAWASSSAPNSARNQDYALTLSTGLASPVVRLSQPSFTQYVFTRWRREFWIGAEPAALRYDWNPRYLLSTVAYPNWDTDYIPNESALAAEYSKFTRLYPTRLTIPGHDDIDGKKGHGAGGIVSFDQSIDAGGEADWIGLGNTWDIMYLLTGDPRMRTMMIENADLAGRFPIWFREADEGAGSGKKFDALGTGKINTQGRVVSVNARQQVTLMLSNWHPGCRGEAADNINTSVPPKSGGWPALDTSHMPDWGYLPYTLTGKYYYLEQLQLQAAYILGFFTGCYDLSNNYWRQGSLALLNRLQRDQAWAMRTVSYAAFASPDGSPEGPYFRDKLLNSIVMLEGAHGLPNSYPAHSTAYNWGKDVWSYSQGRNPSPLGAWQVDSASLDYAIQNVNIKNEDLRAAGSGFQESFLVSALGMVRQLGIADTKPLLSFVGKRYIHTLLDPSVSHYLIEEYVYPEQLKAGNRWVPDWPTFQNEYRVLPRAWGAAETSANIRGFYALSAVSYLTDIRSDGYTGQNAWHWFKVNKPHQADFANVSPKWSLVPLHP